MRQLATMIAADLQDDKHCPRLLVDDDPFVTYEVFEKAYWPWLSKEAIKGLGRDKSSVYSLRADGNEHSAMVGFQRIYGRVTCHYFLASTERKSRHHQGVGNGVKMSQRLFGRAILH